MISVAPATKAIAAWLTIGLVTLLSSRGVAVAQSIGMSAEPPRWGQIGQPTWGTYQNRIGRGGWQSNSGLKPVNPEGSVVNPNASGAPGTSATGGLFTPPDTRLLGRVQR